MANNNVDWESITAIPKPLHGCSVCGTASPIELSNSWFAEVNGETKESAHRYWICIQCLNKEVSLNVVANKIRLRIEAGKDVWIHI